MIKNIIKQSSSHFNA